jgi:hypothetical protein
MKRKSLISLLAIVTVALFAVPGWAQIHSQDVINEQDTYHEHKTCAGDPKYPDGDCLIGSTSPVFQIISDEGDYALLHIEDMNTTSAQRMLIELKNQGNSAIRFENKATNGYDWELQTTPTNSDSFAITKVGTGVKEFEVDGDGNVTIQGSLYANNGSDVFPVPDYVFDLDYELMSIDQLDEFIKSNKHLPNVPSRADIEAAGGMVNMNLMQYRILEKVEELTLYTISQQELIEQQQQMIRQLEERLAEVEN